MTEYSDPRMRYNGERVWPEVDATVAGETPLDRPLRDATGTPALAAIEAGLGAYLKSIGKRADHGASDSTSTLHNNCRPIDLNV